LRQSPSLQHAGTDLAFQVSPKHRMLLSDRRYELARAQHEVFVPADHLISDRKMVRPRNAKSPLTNTS
jgi:hypothetical protein